MLLYSVEISFSLYYKATPVVHLIILFHSVIDNMGSIGQAKGQRSGQVRGHILITPVGH